MYRIAVDAMGGDFAPQEIIEGALKAIKTFPQIIVYLVGQEDKIRMYLPRRKPKRLEIIHAPQVVTMDDLPIEALRTKPESSIRRAFELVKSGIAQAIVSAGNSGAVLATALFVLGRIPGVSRPAIATILPTMKKNAVLIDSGANVDCKPQHLVQFATMGSVFCEQILGFKKPRVGLLSIGEEGGKGNTLVKQTHKLLSESHLNYVGNIEGRDIYKGEVEVIVCDGFVGNICLKLSEGLAEALMAMMAQEIYKKKLASIGFALAQCAIKHFKRRIDWRERGGAPLLGINGVVIISHGRSDEIAIKNAIGIAQEFIEQKLVEKLKEALKETILELKAVSR